MIENLENSCEIHAFHGILKNFLDVVHFLPDGTNALTFARFLLKQNKFKELDDPFYVVNLSDVLYQHKRWTKNLPGIQPFYAVKCNYHPVLLTLLANLGCNFDCASKGEIECVLKLGVHPDRIIYAHPRKSISYIKYAVANQIRMMTFDSEDEMLKILKYQANHELVLRISCPDTTASYPVSTKYGCNPSTEAKSLLKLASKLKANVIGISFHVGWGCNNHSVYGRAISHACDLLEFGRNLGLKMDLLDLGGGYKGEKFDQSFESIASVIKCALSKIVHTGETQNLRVIAEPGTFFAASCFTLFCAVTSLRRVKLDEKIEKTDQQKTSGFEYFFNDGVFGSFIMYELRSFFKPPIGTLLREVPEGSMLYHSVVYGPTCDGLDIVHKSSMLPEMREGDWVAYPEMGAYAYPLSTEFNGYPRPKFFFIASQSDV